MSIWVVLDFLNQSILERVSSQHASQRNVVTLEFGSQYSPRSALFAHDSVRHGLQRVAPFDNVKAYAFMTKTCLATIWHIFCVCFNNGLPRSIRRNSFFVKRTCIDLLGTGRFSSILHGSRVSSNNGLPRSIGSNNGLHHSITTWVWNWLVRLETSGLLLNLSF